MKLESNIDGVIARMKRRPRDIHEAMRRTLDPASWDSVLRKEAGKTLWALARREEWRFVEPFLNSVMVFAAPLKNGFVARMSNPLPPALAIEDFAMARGLQTMALGKGNGPTLFSDFLNQFDEIMADWVANEKRKDLRDAGKSDEEIGQFIGYLMLTPDSKLSEAERAAKKKLMPHIMDYLMRRQSENRLNSETVNAWLLAVLAAWSALVRREFHPRFKEHYHAVKGELN